MALQAKMMHQQPKRAMSLISHSSSFRMYQGLNKSDE